MNLSRNRGFAPLRYAHSPQDISNRVTEGGIGPAKSQKTVSRAKAEPPFATNRPVEARRKGKEGPVGKKARAGATRPFQAIHAPLKRKSQKMVRQDNEKGGRRDRTSLLSGNQNSKHHILVRSPRHTEAAHFFSRNERKTWIMQSVVSSPSTEV